MKRPYFKDVSGNIENDPDRKDAVILSKFRAPAIFFRDVADAFKPLTMHGSVFCREELAAVGIVLICVSIRKAGVLDFHQQRRFRQPQPDTDGRFFGDKTAGIHGVFHDISNQDGQIYDIKPQILMDWLDIGIYQNVFLPGMLYIETKQVIQSRVAG